MSSVGAAWFDAIHLPGSEQMGHLRAFFDGFEWWRLRPAQDVLWEQPGASDATRFAVAARTDDNAVTVVYSPVGGEIALNAANAGVVARVESFDPESGAFFDTAIERAHGRLALRSGDNRDVAYRIYRG